ncbi:DUF1552 domain-containing protein [Archangium lansingense]|uniref:DUF1552 domain-containing protein n=1 Tax=Archangium lansingense TaxID=2995310 RepID=A0ABT4A0B8_9BACT|nr:DUF1552 domain-containing protein [Archangium lansinium]MCY1074424.1 DUF1552 domain-containing protein [Archangium lansinium]
MSDLSFRPTRRFFLKGAGGAVLALPVLPSLLSTSEARAQAATANKCFVGFMTLHGGIQPGNMFPADATLTESMSYAGHTIYRGALNTGSTALSPVLTSPLLSPNLVSKLNVLRGLDITFLIAHHYGMASLGNLAATNDPHPMRSFPRPSIDQVMAWSSAFYPNLTGVRQRSIVATQNSVFSYQYADPIGRSGGIQPVSDQSSSLQIFDRLFPNVGGTQPTRKPIVDLVLGSYSRLRSNSRLSAADKQRLDEHVQRVHELERRLATVPVSCGSAPRPTQSNHSLLGGSLGNPSSSYQLNPDTQVRYFQLLNEVIALGFNCGVTRVASVMGDAYVNTFYAYSRDLWHEEVAHAETTATGQERLVAAQRQFFSGVVMDLATRLEGLSDGAGNTLLDQSLILWMQEHGPLAHEGFNIPVVTVGRAGGFLRTGSYCDYRNRSKVIDSSVGMAPGLTWNQLMGTSLQAMGVPRTEYQEPDHDGYGKRYVQTTKDNPDNPYGRYTGAQAWPDSVWSAAGDVLPYLRA